MINSIDEAAGQVEMVSAMRASADVLKHLHEQVGGTEGVEDVMERLREEGQKVEEVSGVINEGVGVGAGAVDESEVEEELEGLVREGEREKNEKKRAERENGRVEAGPRLGGEQKADLEMPDVPTAEPGAVPSTQVARVEVAEQGTDDEDTQMTKNMEKRLSLMSLDEPQRANDQAGTEKENQRGREQHGEHEYAHKEMSG